MKTFKELGILSPMLQSIGELGFEKPTLIQQKSIPIILDEKDIIAGSKTGSGKTLLLLERALLSMSFSRKKLRTTKAPAKSRCR